MAWKPTRSKPQPLPGWPGKRSKAFLATCLKSPGQKAPGSWARFTQPYFDQPGPVYRLDSVGCCYLVNADLYRWGAKHELDYASKTFIAENREWPEDAIPNNQAGAANSYTEHYSVCAFAREAGLPVRAFADLIALHQKA